jgi:hypothetical protein
MHAQLLSGFLDARVHEQVCVRYCFTASLLLLFAGEALYCAVAAYY